MPLFTAKCDDSVRIVGKQEAIQMGTEQISTDQAACRECISRQPRIAIGSQAIRRENRFGRIVGKQDSREDASRSPPAKITSIFLSYSCME
jgi:hypothetical protein